MSAHPNPRTWLFPLYADLDYLRESRAWHADEDGALAAECEEQARERELHEQPSIRLGLLPKAGT